jgi:hypothetical protein
METTIVVVATLVAAGASLYMLVMNNIKDLKDNWPVYRCNPAYMPFAGLVGKDPFNNFTDCTMKSFQDYTGFIVDPIMAQFSQITGVVTQIGGAMHDMRGMMAQTRTGFLGIIGTVFGKIENLMSQFQYIIIRMRTLMARLVGIMMSFVYIFYAGEQTGQSLINGPVGKTMNFLCFDEDTLIKTNSGSMVYMSDLKLGDLLQYNNAVTSVYVIDGTKVPMYLLGGIKVSGGHKVWYNNTFIPVEDHPEALRTSDSKKLVCINTHLRVFSIEPYIFLNFTESGQVSGLEASAQVYESLMISEVKVGDVLQGDVVRGTVMHAVAGRPVLYNLITEKSMCRPNVEKY